MDKPKGSIKIPEKSGKPAIDLSLDTIGLKKQAIVFCSTKRGAEKTAEDISNSIKEINGIDLSEKALKSLSTPTKQCKRLAKCLKKGVAFHHAGLTASQRDLIEENFRKGRISIIASTPTLAAGLDLPAFRTILKDLRRFGKRGLTYIPVLEYLQMAGRAGRPRYDEYGEAICVVSTEPEKNKVIERYLFGEPEEIYSKLAVEPVLRTYLLSLISTAYVKTKEDIINFFSDTFWAYQFHDMIRLELIIDKMLDLLEHWEFILSTKKKGEFQSAYNIHNTEYRATVIGKRVAELYIDPLTAHHIIKGIRKSTAQQNIPVFSYLQLLCHTLEMSPLLRVGKKDFETVQEKLNMYAEELLEREPSIYESEYEDYLNSVKTASCFYDWANEIHEDVLLDEYNIRPGELKVKLDTIDWLIYSAVELASIQQYKERVRDLNKLRVRLKHGVKEELIPLLRLKGIGRVRARKLYNNKVQNLRDLKSIDFQSLSMLLGKAIAIDVKKQIGIEVSEVSDVKVKENRGQIVLNDFS